MNEDPLVFQCVEVMLVDIIVNGIAVDCECERCLNKAVDNEIYCQEHLDERGKVIQLTRNTFDNQPPTR